MEIKKKKQVKMQGKEITISRKTNVRGFKGIYWWE